MASERETQWIELYIQTGDDKGATRKIFNCSTEKNVTVRSSQLKKNFANEIDKRLRETMRVNSVAMHKILCNLAANATSETVKGNAAKDLLDRGGYKPVDQSEDITERTPDQVEAEYQQALKAVSQKELKVMLQAIPQEQRQALIDGMKETTQ